MTTYSGTDQLLIAQDLLDKHATSSADRRCLESGALGPCQRKTAASVFTQFCRLPQRQPGLTRHANDPDVAPANMPQPAELTQAAAPDFRSATPPAVGPDDGPPGRVAVLAGPVRVLIDPAGVDPARIAPTVDSAPTMAGGVRVYPIAQRRQSR